MAAERWRWLAARALVLGCLVLGVWLRFDYALGHHHGRHFASSDAGDYLERAQALLARGAQPNIMATIWPPGAAALWAALSALDASQECAALCNALASVAVLLLTAACTAQLAGRRAAWLALAIAALHPGFIHYAGFFLAEQPFQCCVALALCMSLHALDTGGSWRGVVSGAAWALACLFRPNALPVVLCASLLVLVSSLLRRDRRLSTLGLGCVLGLGLVLGAAAQRCTAVAGGRTCVVSNNIAMNIALGQAGPVYGLDFRDPARPLETTAWVPPALLHHGYKGLGQVPATIFDSAGVLRWVRGRFAEDPWSFGVRALGNGLDLFGSQYWPDDYRAWPERWVTVWKQLFTLLVLVPAALCGVRWIRALRRAERWYPKLFFALGALLGLFVSAMLSMGEARYRIPFDVLLVALACALYLPDAAPQGPIRPHTSLWVVGGVFVLAADGGILALTHPALNHGQMLPQRAAVFTWGKPAVIEADAARYASPRAPGSPWDAPGNYLWLCAPGCAELRLRFAESHSERRLSLSLDHNDRYRVYWYRAGQRIAHADIGFVPAPVGVAVTELTVPATVTSFDQVGVQPLYGDGAYSLGHILLR